MDARPECHWHALPGAALLTRIGDWVGEELRGCAVLREGDVVLSRSESPGREPRRAKHQVDVVVGGRFKTVAFTWEDPGWEAELSIVVSRLLAAEPDKRPDLVRRMEEEKRTRRQLKWERVARGMAERDAEEARRRKAEEARRNAEREAEEAKQENFWKMFHDMTSEDLAGVKVAADFCEDHGAPELAEVLRDEIKTHQAFADQEAEHRRAREKEWEEGRQRAREDEEFRAALLEKDVREIEETVRLEQPFWRGVAAELLKDRLMEKLLQSDLPFAWRDARIVPDVEVADELNWVDLEDGRYEVACSWFEQPVGSAVVPPESAPDAPDDDDACRSRKCADLAHEIGLDLDNEEIAALITMVRDAMDRAVTDAWADHLATPEYEQEEDALDEGNDLDPFDDDFDWEDDEAAADDTDVSDEGEWDDVNLDDED